MIEKLLANLAVEAEPFALCKLSSGWRIHLPPPPGVVLHFVLQGDGFVINPEGIRAPLKPMSAVIVPAGMPHVLETSGEITNELRIDSPPSDPGVCQILAGNVVPFDVLIACGKINARYGDAIGLFDHLHDILIIDMSSMPRSKSLFEELFDEQAEESPGYEMVMTSIMMQVIILMFRILKNGTHGDLPWLNVLQDERLGLALDKIFKDPGSNHSVESLADTAGMSRSAFAEHFSSAFSTSPIHFVNHVRMERAGQLLKGESTSIDQIANQVGFTSRSHFSQLFKKHTGESPADYRTG
jgi:AraC family transcriptional activator of mtrCDE